MSPGTGTSFSKKVVARVAIVDLDAPVTALLRDCFRQFGIDTVSLGPDGIKRLGREHFDACAIMLGDGAEKVLELIRKSPSNCRTVIYGLSTSPREALRFSRFGINAVLTVPIDRTAALKVVRSTYFLVLHEFRRYVRVPITVEVKLLYRGSVLSGISNEISGGGMSLQADVKPQTNEPVEVSFTLPNQKKTTLGAVICWTRADTFQIGVRFDIEDERRTAVKKWIEDYLEIV